MQPTSAPQWFQMKFFCRATTAASTIISFFLLYISLFGPSWMEVVTRETNESSRPTEVVCNTLVCQASKDSDFTKAARIFQILATATGFTAAFSLFVSCRRFRSSERISNMLVSSVASFTTGTFGYISMTLYTVDISSRELSLVGHKHFTWSFCLAWLVFSLFIMNAFFSLATHILYPVTGFGWHDNQIFLEGIMQEPADEDNMAVGSADLPGPWNPANPEIRAFPVPSTSMDSTFL